MNSEAPPEISPAAARAEEQKAQQRIAVRSMFFPVYFVVAFSLCYISAFHAPSPNHMKIAIVGPPAVTAPLVSGIERSLGGGNEVSAVSSVADATRKVRDREINGAYVPGAPGGPSLIVAGAAGASVTSALEGVFRAVAGEQDNVLRRVDVRPLPDGDSTGTAAFYLLIICTLGGYLTMTVLGQAAPALAPSRRYALLLAAALGTPITVLLIGGAIFGAYSGSFGTLVGLVGIGALYALVVGIIARLLQIVLGQAAILAMMAIFVFLNFPSAGGGVPSEMLPGFWYAIHQFWIGAPALDAFRSVLYFDGVGTGTDVLKLVAWLVVMVALLALPISRKREREREREEVGDAERSVVASPV